MLKLLTDKSVHEHFVLNTGLISPRISPKIHTVFHNRLEGPMSNSMSLEKIFIIMSIILGLGSIIDLVYSVATLNITVDESLRCIANIFIAGLLYLYFNKKLKAKVILDSAIEK